MLRTVKGILKGNKIILEETVPFQEEQVVLLTILDKSLGEEKKIILNGIQKGLEDKEKNNILSFEDSFYLLENLVEI
jgi:hypothetical protein